MPVHPITQTKMAQLERRVLDILERDNGVPVSEHSKEQLVQVERHLMGVFSTLRQVDARLEKRIWDALAAYFSTRQEEKAASLEVVVPEDPVTKETGGRKFKRTSK